MVGQVPEVRQRRIDIGARIRKIRREKGQTIAELARASSLSPSFISQIERDMSVPSIRTLHRLAEVLEIDVHHLLGDGNPVGGAAVVNAEGRAQELQSCVVAADRRTTLVYHGSATRYDLLAPELKSDVEFLWIKAPPGTANAPHPFRHGGRECGVVIQGHVEFRAGDESYILGPGDSIYLGVAVEHQWRVLGDEEWQAVWVIF